MKPKVVLVVPPVASVLRPSIGVSLLKAVLARDNIFAKILYLNIDYAESIGVELNEYLSDHTPPPFLINEWIFSEALVSGNGGQPSPQAGEQYYAFLEAKGWQGPINDIRRLKERADAFATAAALKILEERPGVVGFSTTFQQNCAALAIAERIRRLEPALPICFGGANCEGEMGQTLLNQFPQVDFVFSGESEQSFTRFINTLEAHKGERKVITGTPVEDFASLPAPDYTDYFAAVGDTTFSDRVNPAIPFETARGCWWGQGRHCRFCGLNGEAIRFRKKNAGQISREIDGLFGKWGIPRFIAVDNIMDAPNVLQALESSKAKEYPLSFFWEVRVGMAGSRLNALKTHGVVWMQPGIESLSTPVLKEINKGTDVLSNIWFMRTCRELGITISWNILAGFPDEDPGIYEQMAEMLPLLEHLEPPNSCSAFTLCRFSPYFENQDTHGIRDARPYDTYEMVYGLDKASTQQLAYYFTHAPAPGGTGYLDPVKRRVAAWKKSWARQKPVLTLLPTPDGGKITDRRQCAPVEHCTLDSEEVRVLAYFNTPTPVAEGETTFSPAISPLQYRVMVEAFEQKGYLLTSAGSALSLVTPPPEPYGSTDENAPVMGWLAEKNKPA
ncbi:MAG: RiPP maturation radical SAM C-methyltransferase [Desulfobacter sp.]